MPKYMDVHDGFVGVTAAQFDEAHRADLEIQAEEGVSFDQAWLDPESGKVFCLTTGPSKEAVDAIHSGPATRHEEIYELAYEV